MRARLGVNLTAETLTIAAIVAGAEGNAVGIDVGLRHVGGRSGKGVITQAFRSLLEQRSRVGLNHRRVGIFALARSLKHVAALDLLPAQIAGLARDPTEIFELVVVGLELVVGDTPVLQLHVRRNDASAVASERQLQRLMVPR